MCLVLDRSLSMSDPAGGTSTKNTLLKTAVSVFNSLMLPNDEIALVSFDDQIATPAPMAAVSAATVPPVLAGTDLDPRGSTCIGGGMQQGSTELGSATHSNRSMLVLTDGVQNVHPYVGELPAGTITDRTYAIGFGLPHDINVQVLHDVTANTHGDLIITGAISTDEQTFNLTKYFVQVLAGVSRMDVLLDPQGILMMGSRHVIPFSVTDADVYADVIALCPLPQILDFTLITPSGDVIRPTTPGGNVHFEVDPQVAFYRINLPTLPGNPEGSHAGTWQAVLSLKGRRDVDKLLKDRESGTNAAGRARSWRRALQPDRACLLEPALRRAPAPGRLRARLHRHARGDAARVRRAVHRRCGGVGRRHRPGLEHDAGEAGAGGRRSIRRKFRRDASAGVYPCRVRAEGYFRSKDRFTREKTLTAAVFHGDGGGGAGDDDPLCRLLHCLTRDKVLSPDLLRRLKEMGFDAEAYLRCLESHCPPLTEHAAATPRRSRRASARTVRAEPQTLPAERPVVRPLPAEYPAFHYPARHPHVLDRRRDGRHGRDGRSRRHADDAGNAQHR